MTAQLDHNIKTGPPAGQTGGPVTKGNQTMPNDSMPHGRIPTGVLPAVFLSIETLYRALAITADIAFENGYPQTLLGLRDEESVVSCGCRRCSLILGTFSVFPDLIVTELSANGEDISGGYWIERVDGRAALVVTGLIPEQSAS